MAAGPWTFTNTFREKQFKGQFDFDNDIFKVALFLSTSNIGVTSTTYAALTNEHANANGYTTGGFTVAFTFAGTTSLTLSFTVPSPGNPQWTATGGSIIARFAVLYEVSGDVIAYCLLDSTPADVTATNGNTLTVDNDSVPGPMLTFA